jgi:hypothetical protein
MYVWMERRTCVPADDGVKLTLFLALAGWRKGREEEGRVGENRAATVR